ncbi:unnamed protein product [Ophioblennius macclurei]
MRTLVLLILAFTAVTAKGQRSQFTRYRSWNSRTYPVWKDGDPRFRNCWSGGEVTFTLKNDAPTLTGARSTFTIDINFPPNQTVQSDGQVVWAQNCTVNGRQYLEGQAVYPDQDTDRTGVFPDGTPFTRTRARRPQYVYVWKAWGRYWQVADGPSSSLSINTDNIPLGSYNMELVIYHCRGQDRFIPLGYASSVFTITDQVPFTISLAQVNDVNQNDQSFIQNQAIGFSINLHDPSQYLSNADISFSWDFGDNSGTLISRERSVTHTYVTVGTFKPQVVLMASIPCVNPTAGAPAGASIAPAVVVMASTPAPAAGEGGDAIALDVDTSDATPLAASVQPADAAVNTEDGEAVADPDAAAVEVAPADAAEIDAAAAPAEDEAAAAPAEDEAAVPAAEDAAAEETDAVAEAAEPAAATVAPAEVEAAAADETAVVVDAAEEDVAVIDAAASVAPVAEGEEAAVEEAAVEEAAVEVIETITVAPVVDAAAEPEAEVVADAEPAAAETDAAVEVAETAADVVQVATVAPVDNVVALAATEAAVVEEAAAAAGEAAEAEVTENEVAATAAATGEEAAVPAEGEVQAEVEADPAQVALVLTKRQAPELTGDCTVYRYGSRAASLDVVQGIESVEIVQVSNVVALTTELDQNAVDVTISCQGSLPSEVCTVISDADCITPVQTICNAATPSPDCQMILRQFFNETGVFCLNVSLTNDVSLAVASARVNVAMASGGSPAGTAATVLGVMVLACVVCCIGLMYRRFKQYQPLTEDGTASSGGSSAVTSVPLLLWNLLSRHSPGESRPLLQGRIV